MSDYREPAFGAWPYQGLLLAMLNLILHEMSGIII